MSFVIGVCVGFSVALLSSSSVIWAIFDRLQEAKLRNQNLTSKVHALSGRKGEAA